MCSRIQYFAGNEDKKDSGLLLLCRISIFTAISAIFIPAFPLYFFMYISYYILKMAMGPFFNLQWDALLLESGMLCVLLAAASHPLLKMGILFLFQLLLFRLMFGSGVVKICAPDDSWRNLTAMYYHFLTQPLPLARAKYFHNLPKSILQLFTLGALIIELLVPLLSLIPYFRLVAFFLYLGLQVSIGATGRFGFFNFLTAILGLSLLRDEQIHQIFCTMNFPSVSSIIPFQGHILSLNIVDIYGVWMICGHICSFIIDVIISIASIAILFSNLVSIKNLCNRFHTQSKIFELARRSKSIPRVVKSARVMLPTFIENFHSSLALLFIGCHYGLFANMTKHRDEILVDVCWEGYIVNENRWEPIKFR